MPHRSGDGKRNLIRFLLSFFCTGKDLHFSIELCPHGDPIKSQQPYLLRHIIIIIIIVIITGSFFLLK